MDSWGMDLMEEAAWLKNSANENLNGIWKIGADALVDEAQSVALLPLLLAGPKAYVAGVATNAAAEDMFEQTEKGKAPHKALVSGALTAGTEVAGKKISDIKNVAWKDAAKEIASDVWEFSKKAMRPGNKVTVKQVWDALQTEKDAVKVLLEGLKLGTNKESAIYLMNFLTDKLGRDPEAEFNLDEFVQGVVTNKASNFAEKKWNDIAKEIVRFWDTLE